MSNESLDETDPRLERLAIADRAVDALVHHAEENIQELLAGKLRSRPVGLISGPEGGTVTERTIQRLTADAGLHDLRTLEAKPGPDDDPQVEAVFEGSTDTGLILRLSRVRSDNGEAWLELSAALS